MILNKVFVICGPTGVGKTKLGIELAKHLNGEVINADSTQVYKHMNIGTAKVTTEEAEGIPHHLIDLLELDEEYSVYDFQQDCRDVIEDIINRGKIPIIVGGTGLYVKAALYNYDFKDEEEKYNYDGLETEELYEQLIQIDPDTTIHQNNRKRVERALTFYKNNNEPQSTIAKSDILLYDAVFIGLTTDRETLYARINKRTDKMIADGLIEEARYLYDSGIRSRALLTPIAYKELFEYFDGNISFDDAVELIKQRCRKYAKRQYTWFRNQFDVRWYEVNFDNFDKTVESIIKEIH